MGSSGFRDTHGPAARQSTQKPLTSSPFQESLRGRHYPDRGHHNEDDPGALAGFVLGVGILLRGKGTSAGQGLSKKGALAVFGAP